jgi:hypothetical protein
VLSELVYKGFMEEVLDVFGVVEGGGGGCGFVGFPLVARFSRVDTFMLVSDTLLVLGTDASYL